MTSVVGSSLVAFISRVTIKINGLNRSKPIANKGTIILSFFFIIQKFFIRIFELCDDRFFIKQIIVHNSLVFVDLIIVCRNTEIQRAGSVVLMTTGCTKAPTTPSAVKASGLHFLRIL